MEMHEAVRTAAWAGDVPTFSQAVGIAPKLSADFEHRAQFAISLCSRAYGILASVQKLLNGARQLLRHTKCLPAPRLVSLHFFYQNPLGTKSISSSFMA